MYHWCPSRDISECLMDRQEAAMTVLQVRKHNLFILLKLFNLFYIFIRFCSEYFKSKNPFQNTNLISFQFRLSCELIILSILITSSLNNKATICLMLVKCKSIHNLISFYPHAFYAKHSFRKKISNLGFFHYFFTTIFFQEMEERKMH